MDIDKGKSGARRWGHAPGWSSGCSRNPVPVSVPADFASPPHWQRLKGSRTEADVRRGDRHRPPFKLQPQPQRPTERLDGAVPSFSGSAFSCPGSRAGRAATALAPGRSERRIRNKRSESLRWCQCSGATEQARYFVKASQQWASIASRETLARVCDTVQLKQRCRPDKVRNTRPPFHAHAFSTAAEGRTDLRPGSRARR
ncbi:hypothetical protein C8Q78DRAFT_799508 [Trametes maxima]|nr:hypothetical protein C8Q78DRAFT_799508 [Trametes maxima]